MSIASFISALRNAAPKDATDRMTWALDGDASRDRGQLPLALTRPMTALELEAIVFHEIGHILGMMAANAQNMTVRVRGDGTGIATCDRIENPQDRIRMHLAGPVAQSVFMPSHAHRFTGTCLDILAARAAIDEINEAARWPVMSCQRAAETAHAFVKSRWAQIGDLALALGNTGELTDTEIRLFGTCRQ